MNNPWHGVERPSMSSSFSAAATLPRARSSALPLGAAVLAGGLCGVALAQGVPVVEPALLTLLRFMAVRAT